MALQRKLTGGNLPDVLAGLFALAFYACLAVAVPGSPGASRISEVAFFPLGLAVAWVNWRNSRIPGLDQRTRLAWLLLACAALMLWCSGNAWTLWVHFRGAAGYPPWINHLALGQYVLSLAGYLCFPSRSQPRANRVRYLLDIGMVVVAGFLLAFHFGLAPMLKGATSGDVLLNSVLEWALFVVAAMGLLQKRDSVARIVLGFLLMANCFYLAGNYVLAGLDRYVVGHPVDGLWFAAWVLRWTAASVAWHAYRRPAREEARDAVGDFQDYRTSAFSYLLVGGAFLLLEVLLLMGDQRYMKLMAGSAALMAGILILRQLAELRENRRLFAAHLAQEARFRSLVQNSSDVVLVVDADLKLTYVSPSAARVFGDDGPVQVGIRLSDLFPPDAQEDLSTFLFNRAGPGRLFQGRMPAAHGTWRDVEIQADDLRSDPAVQGIVLTCRDVTGRIELERQFQHAQKLDAVGKLAGGIAHDFNNMLAVMLARLDLMTADGTLEERMLAHIRSMEEAVHRSSGIVRQLLAFSRRQVIAPVVLDVNARIEGMYKGLAPLLGEEVQLVFSPAPGLWCIRMDPSQWDQILMNLVINAKDASPRGGRIQVATSNVHIEELHGPSNPDARPGDYVLLSVTDQGDGMDVPTQARIFEPFFTTKQAGKGTGLGLSTVFGIVTQNAGFVNVDSEPGQGSTFRLYLPAIFDLPESPGVVPPGDPVQGTGSVLLVEDNEGLREGLVRVIESFGYTVRVAQDVAGALGLLRDGSVAIDVLLTDVIMPGQSGKELSDLASQVRPGLRVLFMSGYTAEVIAEKGVLPEDVCFIQKPFSSVALRLKLQEVLARPA